MKLRLRSAGGDAALAVLRAARDSSPRSGAPRTFCYLTRTGALLRIAGVVRGAFDREHERITLSGESGGDVTLEVERRSLPTRWLPSGDGLRWRWMLARARAQPARTIRVVTPSSQNGLGAAAPEGGPIVRSRRPALQLVGHSHLDVAWLWTYEEAARKAVRTFATAVRQLELDPSFIFTQSQPQLYEFVREREPALFARIAALAREERFDASGAAFWVESDVTLPSGESLLRQLAFGIRYAELELGTTPSVAWLPDSFGFPNTLPTLLAHAGVNAFGTTKLRWNDTTRFPFAQFVWKGPDGSEVVAAQIDSIAGAFGPWRVRPARARGDLLLVGEGDGGGGTTDGALEAAPRFGTWTTLARWFANVAERHDSLPVVRDELYLEYHRGTATTHHDVKAGNAALERALREAEELLAWAYALRATPFFLDEARAQLARAWTLVLCAQFHDVLPGSAIGPVYADTLRSYEEAQQLIAHVARGARSVLPTTDPRTAPMCPASAATTPATRSRQTAAAETRLHAATCPPRADDDGYVFASTDVWARVRTDGTLVELRVPGGPNLVRDANRIALYRDRPRRWDAWNLDRTYRDRPLPVRATFAAIAEDTLEVRYEFGRSLAVARFSLTANEPFLRVEVAVAWHERHAVLRVESALAFAGTRARFGTPHGAVERAVAPRTVAECAKFEAAGQRYGRIDGTHGGLALLTLDTYGWSVESRGDATHLGQSLLRAPTWPDPHADRGEHAFALAYLPFMSLGMGELEASWERFAREPSVAMFVPDDAALLVTATKLADDGDGIVLRVRECDGIARVARIACGIRALEVTCVDALERPAEGQAQLEDAALVARFAPYQLRSFRIRVR